MVKDADIDTRIREIDKYLDKLKDPDTRYEWKTKLTTWLETEGIPRKVANNFSHSLFFNSLCDDNFDEVILAINENEILNQFFEPWVKKYREEQTR